MTQADSVLSTPPTNAPSVSAPGAVQLSSPPVIPLAPVAAGQGVKNEPEPFSGSAIQKGGAAVNRRTLMNMLVGSAAIATAAALPHRPCHCMIPRGLVPYCAILCTRCPT